MKKWTVENRVMDADQIDGSVPHDELLHNQIGYYVEADTAEEAIDLAISYLCDEINDNQYAEIRVYAERIEENGEDVICIYNSYDDEIVEKYFGFVAKPYDEENIDDDDI